MTWKFMAKYSSSSNMSICSINFHGKLFHLTTFLSFFSFVIEMLLFFVVIDRRTHNIFSSKNILFYLFWLKIFIEICVTVMEYIHFKVKKTLKWNDTMSLLLCFLLVHLLNCMSNTNMNNLSEFHGIVSIKTQSSLQFIHHQHETWFKTRF